MTTQFAIFRCLESRLLVVPLFDLSHGLGLLLRISHHQPLLSGTNIKIIIQIIINTIIKVIINIIINIIIKFIISIIIIRSITTSFKPPQLTYSDASRGWVSGYEAAITNHYSPELRARVHGTRINGMTRSLSASVQGAVLGHRCNVVDNGEEGCPHFEQKVSSL